jgi:Flp pilus assembly CpaE family ATPase
MASERRLLLATKEDDFAKKLKSILHSSKSKPIGLGSVCSDISELRVHLEQAPEAIAVIDIDHNPAGMLKELDKVTPLYPGTYFAVVSSTSSQELILEAMNAGVRHFMRKKSIEEDLDRVLERLLSDDVRKAYAAGSVISVFSAGGGCGATTVVLNLANELRLAAAKSVLVIDLDNYYGAVSSYLGLNGSYCLTDVLTREGPIDKNLVVSSAANYMKDFHVLTSPAGKEQLLSGKIEYPKLLDFLEACRQAYKYTVIDAPRPSEDVARLLATISRVILIVFQQTVKDIKIAKSMIVSLTKLGARPEKIVPLTNKFRRFGPVVTLEAAKSAIGLDHLHRIRNDFRRAVDCINRGEPLAKSAPRSGIRRDFQKLAAAICANGTNNSQLAG